MGLLKQQPKCKDKTCQFCNGKYCTILKSKPEVCRFYKAKAEAEAYKEFAEIIKDKWFDNRYDSPDVDFDDFIDNVLKELVGEGR